MIAQHLYARRRGEKAGYDTLAASAGFARRWLAYIAGCASLAPREGKRIAFFCLPNEGEGQAIFCCANRYFVDTRSDVAVHSLLFTGEDYERLIDACFAPALDESNYFSRLVMLHSKKGEIELSYDGASLAGPLPQLDFESLRSSLPTPAYAQDEGFWAHFLAACLSAVAGHMRVYVSSDGEEGISQAMASSLTSRLASYLPPSMRGRLSGAGYVSKTAFREAEYIAFTPLNDFFSRLEGIHLELSENRIEVFTRPSEGAPKRPGLNEDCYGAAKALLAASADNLPAIETAFQRFPKESAGSPISEAALAGLILSILPPAKEKPVSQLETQSIPAEVAPSEPQEHNTSCWDGPEPVWFSLRKTLYGPFER